MTVGYYSFEFIHCLQVEAAFAPMVLWARLLSLAVVAFEDMSNRLLSEKFLDT